MAALWLIVIIGVTGYELSVRSRTQRLAVANSLERVAAEGAAQAGLETARAMLEGALAQPLDAGRGSLTSAMLDPWSATEWRGDDTIRIGDARVVVVGYDAGTRLHLNRTNEEELRRLLVALSLDAGIADRMAQRIMDWRDADGLRRGRGAEREEYVRAGARVLPSDAAVARIDELRDVDGMTPALFARVAPFLTVHGTGQINANTAPTTVLRALAGLGDEAIAVLVRSRRSARPIRSLDELILRLSPGDAAAIGDAGTELSQRLTFETREMVVTADGWVDGSPIRARAEALYARSGDALLVTGPLVSEP